MRKSALLIFAAVALLALPAIARDPTGLFPGVLIDSTCTDDNDTPAVGTPSAPQTSGSSDDLCDGDTDVATGTIAADAEFGPIGSQSFQNAYLYIVASASGATPTWRICIKIQSPVLVDSWNVAAECSETISGAVSEGYIGLGPMFVSASESDAASPMPQPLPARFKVQVDIIGTTGWVGSIGVIPVHGGGK